MLRIDSQKAHSFDDLTSLQFAWDFTVSQLGPIEQISSSTLYQTTHAGYNTFRYGCAYDQRLCAKQGFVSFGLLDLDNPTTWLYDQVLPNDVLVIFPQDEAMKAASPVGFCGNGMHFLEAYLENLAQLVYQQPLNLLLPAAGFYQVDSEKLAVLRAELCKWQQLPDHGAETREAIISRREESLALAILDALPSSKSIKKTGLKKSERSTAKALDFIHGSELEHISAVELCKQAQCSQRSLEKSFLKRFGVTPKKYIKCLRLAKVNQGLRKFNAQQCDSIIELAACHGFWHMGQFAADYRNIYGELPSETLNRS
jgi:AraC family ethanolamine operon transcriptional activator